VRRMVHSSPTGPTELSELGDPPPALQECSQGYLEDEKAGTEGTRPFLSELGAPLPASDRDDAVRLHRGDTAPLSENATYQDSQPGHVNGSHSTSRAFEDSNKNASKLEALYSPALTELYTISWLIFFSFWGTLARLGVEAITLYPNSPVTSRVLWANLGGSFMIGFLTEDRRLFQQEWGSPNTNAEHAAHVKVKKTIPLYIGLATGFCGSFTSFSSFMKDAFLALTNDLEAPSPTTPYHVDPVIHSRNGGFSFLALLAILIVQPAVSIAALKAGAHFALLVQPITPVLSLRLTRSFMDPAAVVLAFGCWLGAVFLSIWPPGNDTHWRFRATLPLVFSPPGCLLRFYLSKYLNGKVATFPLGTFVANIFATVFLGMAWDLQHATGIGAGNGASAAACSVLQGIIEGFCGCLSTVSTWVLELDGLRRRHAWTYGLSSVIVGLALMIVIMGSMGWTVGFATPSCS
jgi:fluoride exporter